MPVSPTPSLGDLSSLMERLAVAGTYTRLTLEVIPSSSIGGGIASESARPVTPPSVEEPRVVEEHGARAFVRRSPNHPGQKKSSALVSFILRKDGDAPYPSANEFPDRRAVVIRGYAPGIYEDWDEAIGCGAMAVDQRSGRFEDRSVALYASDYQKAVSVFELADRRGFIMSFE